MTMTMIRSTTDSTTLTPAKLLPFLALVLFVPFCDADDFDDNDIIVPQPQPQPSSSSYSSLLQPRPTQLPSLQHPETHRRSINEDNDNDDAYDTIEEVTRESPLSEDDDDDGNNLVDNINDSTEYRSLTIVNNNTHVKVAIYWMDPDLEELVLESEPDLMPGAELYTSGSFYNYFEAWELPDNTGHCKALRMDDEEEEEQEWDEDEYYDDEYLPDCRWCSFRISNNHEQVVTINQDLECDFEDTRIVAQRRAAQMMEECLAATTTTVNNGHDDDDDALRHEQLAQFTKCAQQKVTQFLDVHSEEYDFESTLRKSMAQLSQDYMCHDTHRQSTDAEYTETWTYPPNQNEDAEEDSASPTRRNNDNEDESVSEEDNKDSVVGENEYKVEVHLDQAASKIYLLQQFVTPHECQALMTSLGHESDDNHEIIEPATISSSPPPSSSNATTTETLVQNASERIFAYANDVLYGVDISATGQEPLSIKRIQQEPNANGDNDNDFLKQHFCPSGCDGQSYPMGSPVASMIIYCHLPPPNESGGSAAVNFGNAGIHLRPQHVGDAIFVGYVHARRQTYDSGWTQLSTCPSGTEQQQQVVVQNIRWGVSEERPYSYFNVDEEDRPTKALHQQGEEAKTRRHFEMNAVDRGQSDSIHATSDEL